MSLPRTLADAVDKVARQSAGKDWGLYANLLEHWTEIVGPDYARQTTPIKISFPFQPNEAQRKNGILTIRLPKGLAMEFSFKADLIRQRVNSYFGYDCFARVALDPAALPLPRAPRVPHVSDTTKGIVKETASVIENEELREALERFGETVLTENK